MTVDEIAYDIIETQFANIPIHSVEINDEKFQFLIILKLSKSNKTNIYPTIRSIACNCNTCCERLNILMTSLDNNGKYFLFDTCNDNIQKINCINNLTCNIKDLTIEVFDDIFNQKFLNNSGGFQHFIMPKFINDTNLTQKFYKLKHYINAGFENRLSKIIIYHNYLKEIKKTLPLILRQNHWEPTLTWALNVAEKTNNIIWEEINISNKIKIMIFALLTGNSEGSVHYNFQKIENFLDFASDNLIQSDLIIEMNKRSDPNNYMVSRVAKALTEHCVTAPMTITLCWASRSDLDLHAYITDEYNQIHHVFFGNKIVKDNTGEIIASLDFDANVTTILKAPCENISVFIPSKSVRIVVVNYTNRDGKKSIPYEITIRRGGKETDTITSEWLPIYSDNEITITTLQIDPKDLCNEVEISSTQIDKFNHKSDSWLKYFGNPISNIANIRLDTDKLLYKRPNNVNFISQFNSLINKNNNITLDEFIKLLKSKVYENKNISFKNYKDIVPAYVTNITCTDSNGNTNIVSRNENNICVYYHQNELPMKLDPSKKSLARLDNSWIENNFITKTLISIKVLGILEINNEIFFALDGLKLPNSDTFPLAGGFYGSDLLPEYHSHRSQYSCCNYIIKPNYEKVPNHISLIGTVLSSITNIELIINNQLLVISNN